MRLPKKKAKIVLDAVTTLQADQVIAPEIAEVIRAHVEPISFDWRRLARYSFIASLICVVMSILTAVFDEMIVRWFERMLPYIARLFNAPPPVRSGALLLLSAVIFRLGLKRRAKFPDRIYSNEAIFTFGVLGIGGAVYSLSRMNQYVDLGTYNFRWDCLIWALLFGAVAVVAVARSLEKDDSVLRGFGLTFFFINLYTAFFQYFWNGIHKAIFFAILGASFWLLGRKAESLWKMKSFRKRADSSSTA